MIAISEPTHELFAAPRTLAGLMVALCICCTGCKTLSNKPTCDTCSADAAPIDEPLVNADLAVDELHPNESDGQGETLTVQPATYPIMPPVAVHRFPEPNSESPAGVETQYRSQTPFPEQLTVAPSPATTMNTPHISGFRLGTEQTPASARALQLQAENQRLVSSQKTILADNERLRNQATKTQSLLDRMTAAMSGAQSTLEKAERANQDLKRELAERQRQQKRDQLNSERMLESIRDELDDVLMREIALQQK